MIRTIKAAAILLNAALAAGAPVRGGMTPAPGDGDPLWAVANEYASAMLAGDAGAVAAAFADDAVEMPPGSAPVKGRAAIEAYYRALFRKCRFTTFALSPAESRVVGDLGFVAGTSRVAVSPLSGAGAAPEEPGKYLVVLKRVRSGWKVAYAIYNADRVARMGAAGR